VHSFRSPILTAINTFCAKSSITQKVKNLNLGLFNAPTHILSQSKKAAAIANHTGKWLDDRHYNLVVQACDEILAGRHHVARKGQINAWDNPDFVEAVKATGRKTLIIAGTITSVCMAFPAIAAAHEGYKVFAVIDASGTYSKMAEEITLARIVQAGVVPMDTAAVASELQKTRGATGRPACRAQRH
jgi:nicotinamidase-related amidase